MKGKQKIAVAFKSQREFFDYQAFLIVSESAVETYKDAFRLKAWDGTPWAALSPGYNPGYGEMMVRDTNLVNSIRPTVEEPDRVIISAGNSKVPYARIHNEGGVIVKYARSETFNRNRFKSGKTQGKYKKGTTKGQGFTFKEHTIVMPQRQYMGYGLHLKRYMSGRLIEAHNQIPNQ